MPRGSPSPKAEEMTVGNDPLSFGRRVVSNHPLKYGGRRAASII